MKKFQAHRFPPLSELVVVGSSQHGPSGLQPSPSDLGFVQSRQDGLRIGHEAALAEGRRNGFAEGLSDGLAEGRREGLSLGAEEGRRVSRASFEALAQPVDAMLEALRKLQSGLQRAQGEELVELVAKVARQVIRAELALQPAQLLALVDETLATMPASNAAVEVYLHPAQLQGIRELDAERAERWTLIADARLAPGECRVKSGHHEVDAGCQQRLAACMAQVKEQLLESADDAELAA
jgi:flagellar assembly protein FliH